jgi:hypothetical protein
MTQAPLVIVGDALLDRDLEGRAGRLAPDAPVPVVDDPTERRRPGGAALAATLAARLDGRAVVLVTALAGDEAGTALRELLELAGVEVVDLELAGRTPEKIRVRADGHSLLRLDRATRPGRVGPLDRPVGAPWPGPGRCWWPTTGGAWPPSRACGPPWPACPAGGRWSGTPIRAARRRSRGLAWPPRTAPRRPASSPRSTAMTWPR